MASLPANPFSDRTYREKRALLGVATAAIALVEARLVPEKIPALGVEQLTVDARIMLVVLLFGILCYFSFAFVLYAVVDYIEWRGALQQQEAELNAEMSAHQKVGESLTSGNASGVGEAYKVWLEHELANVRLTAKQEELERARASRWVRATTPAAWTRLFFDFGFPVVWTGSALWCLWNWTPS